MFASESHALKQLLASATSAGSATALANGDNTLTKPAGADYLLFAPDERQAIVCTLKGNGADTGVIIASATDRSPSVINVTGASVIINSGGASRATVVWASKNGRLVGA